MTRNYIYSEQEIESKVSALKKQGKDVAFDRPSTPYWWNRNGYADFWPKMAIEGYSEVVEVWDIDDSCANDKYHPIYVVRHHGHALHVLGTDLYFFIHPAYKKDGKYVLYDDRSRVLPIRYFKTELQEPNAIGEPTKNKIAAWVDYLTKLHAEQTAYVDANEAKAKAQETALLHNYPDAKVYSSEDGIIREIRFTDGPINYKYERSETGFCRSYSINYWKVPSFEEQTTIKA